MSIVSFVALRRSVPMNRCDFMSAQAVKWLLCSAAEMTSVLASRSRKYVGVPQHTESQVSNWHTLPIVAHLKHVHITVLVEACAQIRGCLQPDDRRDCRPHWSDVRIDSPSLRDSGSPILRLLPSPLTHAVDHGFLIVPGCNSIDGISHTLEAAEFILFCQVVVWAGKRSGSVHDHEVLTRL